MTTDRATTKPGMALLVGAALITGGTFLTWTRLPGKFPFDPLGYFPKAGIDTFRGKAVLFLGVAMMVLGILAALSAPAVSLYRGPIGMAACLASISVVLLLLWHAASLRSTREPLTESAPLEALELHTGWGMAVGLLGALIALWGGYRTIRPKGISDPGEA